MIHLASFISKGDLNPTFIQKLMLFTKIRVMQFVASGLPRTPNTPFFGEHFPKLPLIALPILDFEIHTHTQKYFKCNINLKGEGEGTNTNRSLLKIIYSVFIFKLQWC